MRRRIINKIITQPQSIGRTRIIKSNVGDNNESRTKAMNSPTVIPHEKVSLNWGKVDMSKVTYTKVEPLYKGQTVYIIGGGPSLKGFNWDLLKGKKVIAINRAYEFCKAEVVYWTDGRFYQWNKDELDALTATKYTIQPSANQINVNVIRRGMRHGLETNPSMLAHGDNSGYAAINLAYHLGAKQIVLLGYDMGNVNGESHFHDGYQVSATTDDTYETRFMKGFPYLADMLKEKGINVWNVSPISKLTCFQRLTIEQALRL
jgi:hypothetical protein